MERYAEYKESSVPWVGSTPSSWEVKRIKFILSNLDARRKPIEAINRTTDGDVLYDYYGASGVIDQIDDYIYDETTILIGEDGANLVMRNLPLIYIAKGKYWVNNHAHILVPKRGNDLRFMAYQMEIVDYHDFITGSAQPKLTQQNLSNVALAVPSYNEQMTIADYLDRRTAEIDTLLADLTRQAEMLDAYKRELIAEAVTKGLDKSAAMKDSDVDYIGTIPEAWELLPLFAVATENNVKNTGLVCENLLSLSYGKIIQKDIDTNFGLLPASFEGYQIVQPGYTVLRFTDLQNDKRSLRSGYVTETGIITSAYMGLIPGERLDSKYFNYLLHAYDLLKVYYGMGGGLRQTLKFSDVKRLPVLIPSMQEQKAIVAYVDKKTAKIEGLIADIKSQIEKLKQYRQIVIHDAVTGKVKVTEG